MSLEFVCEEHNARREGSLMNHASESSLGIEESERCNGLQNTHAYRDRRQDVALEIERN